MSPINCPFFLPEFHARTNLGGGVDFLLNPLDKNYTVCMIFIFLKCIVSFYIYFLNPLNPRLEADSVV